MSAITFLYAFLNRSNLPRADERAGVRSLRTLVAGSLLALLPVLSASAATFVVTTTADGNHGACTGSLCTLRDAVIAANANAGADIITLPAGLYSLTLTGANEDNAATGDLDIRGDLTINGAGVSTTVIDGNGTDRVFEIFGTSVVVINDMTITNGNLSSEGGAIEAFFGTLTLNNCIVTGNNTTGQGGGIFATTLTLTGSTISNNHSTTDQGGGLFLINGASNITGSVITGNTAGPGADGGGIYLNGSININSPAILNITNSTIGNNSAPDGGGMFLLSIATVTITGSTINGNMATAGGGGGILNDGATLVLTNSTITGNSITGGSTGGGGIFNNGGSAAATVTSSTISANSAPGSTGGGILNNSGTVSIKNTIVANNTGSNCVGTIGNGGTNLQFPGTTCGAGITSADPLLQALASNGGSTQTESLGSGSPAINTAGGCPPPATDQRGVTRPQGSACDIGAFECQTGECGGVGPTATPTNTPVGVATATPTNTPTNTPTTVAATPTRTSTPIAGVVVPTLTFPMLALLGIALAGAALLILKK